MFDGTVLVLEFLAGDTFTRCDTRHWPCQPRAESKHLRVGYLPLPLPLTRAHVAASAYRTSLAASPNAPLIHDTPTRPQDPDWSHLALTTAERSAPHTLAH
jgi:hypothetical protein